jgi:hypothetical protein
MPTFLDEKAIALSVTKYTAHTASLLY